jgi:hypothetical protein
MDASFFPRRDATRRDAPAVGDAPRARGRRGARRLCVALTPVLLAALAGCANLASVPAGTPLADVEQSNGKPSYTCTRPDGTRRVIWTQQPSGSYAWGTDVDAQGRVAKVEQVLDSAHFRLIQPGWTPEQVRCEFGPPAEIREAGLGSLREVVWSYRYVQDIRWHSVEYVYMGADGNAVTHYHSGPDDRYQRSE